MMTILLYIVSSIAFVGALSTVVSVIRVRRETREKQQQLTWIRGEANRAVTLINSSDSDRVITGLQTLSALNERHSRIAALHRIAELTTDADPSVAEYARAAFKVILPAADKTPRS